MELAESGITLTPNKNNTTELSRMGLHQDGTLFAELYLAPLSLDHNRASYLVNMAALELCTVRSFSNAPDEEASAVCSYILVLAMLVNREEDVHELRARDLLLGGGGLTDQQALSFFTSLQGLRRGRCYLRIMRDIERYKEERRMQIKMYSFFHNNKRIIAAVVSALGALGGITSTLQSIRRTI
ncbi:hypothetical protein U9M48_000667 [Paspalum notatum var. saurae]|uniref:Uncharacterized protein n=1 Tax=Paspalum notatum var. saurae TaxID=547442 RepID=A0AAQ3SCH3_PASNO